MKTNTVSVAASSSTTAAPKTIDRKAALYACMNEVFGMQVLTDNALDHIIARENDGSIASFAIYAMFDQLNAAIKALDGAKDGESGKIVDEISVIGKDLGLADGDTYVEPSHIVRAAIISTNRGKKAVKEENGIANIVTRRFLHSLISGCCSERASPALPGGQHLANGISKRVLDGINRILDVPLLEELIDFLANYDPSFTMKGQLRRSLVNISDFALAAIEDAGAQVADVIIGMLKSSKKLEKAAVSKIASGLIDAAGTIGDRRDLLDRVEEFTMDNAPIAAHNTGIIRLLVEKYRADAAENIVDILRLYLGEDVFVGLAQGSLIMIAAAERLLHTAETMAGSADAAADSKTADGKTTDKTADLPAAPKVFTGKYYGVPTAEDIADYISLVDDETDEGRACLREPLSEERVAKLLWMAESGAFIADTEDARWQRDAERRQRIARPAKSDSDSDGESGEDSDDESDDKSVDSDQADNSKRRCLVQ